eukprot:CAMPEP_0194267042 /NCGR_PEP_ID=MMETSP0169-20130528/1720_1 /TAXON_ID=218684 /ORGANISM="Corethron pennatum, Strain L29A3" /LENGTH=137 /DNA_ID=CAMNT_0039007839 /DNA_START=29 /DNA_END=438 /DNA_ORIENTATION=+
MSPPMMSPLGLPGLMLLLTTALLVIAPCTSLFPSFLSTAATRPSFLFDPTIGTPPPTASRRSAFAALFAAGFTVPAAAIAQTEITARDDGEAERKAAAAERMRQKIAESKQNYRKPADLVRERKETADYSCVAETGS